MTTPISFRLPAMTTMLSPVYGIPLGTHGRGAQVPRAIILHSLRLSLDSFDAQCVHPERVSYRDRAQVRHPSLHYGIDYEGNIHRYVHDLDIAHGMWAQDMGAFPTAYPEGNWAFLTTYDGVTPDYYALHIGMMSGEIEGGQPFSAAALKSHARLLAWLCNLYEITCDAAHVTMHGTIDLQFADICKADAAYPYAAILAAAQAIITAGGELDPIFDNQIPELTEYFGIFTVGVSRVGSMAYIRTP